MPDGIEELTGKSTCVNHMVDMAVFNPSTRGLMLKILAAAPGSTSSQCRVLLAEKGRNISRQAVFKELQALRKEGAVVKAGLSYALNPAWLSETESLVQLAWQRSRDLLLTQILRGGGAGCFSRSFTSFVEADDLWTLFLMTALKESSSRIIYQWHPSLWFLLLGSDREVMFHTVIGRLKGQFYSICAPPEGPLEEAMYRAWNFPRVIHSFAASPFHKYTRTHITVIDDIIIEMHLNTKAVSLLRDLRHIKAKPSLTALGTVASIATSRCGIRMVMKRDRKKAAENVKLFRQYFGIR